MPAAVQGGASIDDFMLCSGSSLASQGFRTSVPMIEVFWADHLRRSRVLA